MALQPVVPFRQTAASEPHYARKRSVASEMRRDTAPAPNPGTQGTHGNGAPESL